MYETTSIIEVVSLCYELPCFLIVTIEILLDGIIQNSISYIYIIDIHRNLLYEYSIIGMSDYQEKKNIIVFVLCR